MRGILERNRQRTADNRWVQYLRPAGLGKHVVRNFTNPRPYIVGSAIQRMTFVPGSQVLVASNTGEPGEIIIGAPSPGRRGGNINPPNLPRAPTGAPTGASGRKYLGLNLASGQFEAYDYLDGTRGDTIAIMSDTGLGANAQLRGGALVSAKNPIIIGMTWEYTLDSIMDVVWWNIDTATVSIIDRWGVRAASFGLGPAMSNWSGTLYWTEVKTSGTDEYYLMSTSNGTSAGEVGGGVVGNLPNDGEVPYLTVQPFDGASAMIPYGDDCGTSEKPGCVVVGRGGATYVPSPQWAEVPYATCPRDGWATVVGGFGGQSVKGRSAGLYAFNKGGVGGSITLVRGSSSAGHVLVKHEDKIADGYSLHAAVPSPSGSDMVIRRSNEFVRVPLSPIADVASLPWTTISPTVGFFLPVD